MDLPRERLAAHGPDSLSMRELLALIIGSGVRGSSLFTVADVLAKTDLRRVSVQQLCRIRGVGVAKASAIVAALHLSHRLGDGVVEKILLDNPRKVHEHMLFLRDKQQEHFYGLYVDNRKRLLGKHLLFKGTVDATVVHPRDVFRHALECNASGVIVVHNHPSGSIEPSTEDIVFTKRLDAVANTMHIPLLDHVIIGDGYWSYVEHS